MKRNTTNLKFRAGAWGNWGFGFGIWTLIGMSFATRAFLTNYRDGTVVPWQEVLASNLMDFYLWGLVSPLIFGLSRRFPIERNHLISRLLLYLTVGSLLSWIIIMTGIPLYWYLGFPDKGRFPTLKILFAYLITSPYLYHQSLMVFGGTVVVAHALEYYRQFQIGKMRATELATQLAQAQLTALKMQIHPHFLFNTLNSIAALLHKDVEAADRMIARLSDFLRLTLKSSDAPSTTLAKEIDFLRTYLEIEKIRFEERLTITIEVDPQVLDAQVPSLILQPLVENAVRHGIAKQTTAGVLRIGAEQIKGRLLIEVEDNGAGLRRNGNSRAENIGTEGVGLANTRARLERFYGPDFRFEISEKLAAKGTLVTLEVPFLTSSKDETKKLVPSSRR